MTDIIQALHKSRIDLPEPMRRSMVALLNDRLAGFGSHVRAAIIVADKSGDADTTDLFTQISRAIDQDLWMVEAHLQAAS